MHINKLIIIETRCFQVFQSGKGNENISVEKY